MDPNQLHTRRTARAHERRRRQARRRGAAVGALITVVVLAVVALAFAGGGDPAQRSSSTETAATRHSRRHHTQPSTGHHRGASTMAALGPATGHPGTLSVPILMYHVIAPPPAGAPFPGLYVPPAQFAQEMEALKGAGWTP